MMSPSTWAERAQDRHLAAAVFESDQQCGEHADQADQNDEGRHHHQQRVLSQADHRPEYGEGNVGQDCQQGLARVLIDAALQREGGDARFQPDQHRGDGLRRQTPGARLLDIDRASWHRRAALPAEVDGLDRLQADMHAAIDRGAGALEDAGDAKRLVLMAGEADIAGAVGDDDRIAEPITERGRDLGAEHGVVEIGEALALGQHQRLIAPVAIVIEIGRAGAEHRKAAMRIPEREWHCLGHARHGGNLLIALPGEVVGGVADAKHRVQHQLHRPAARADDEISAGESVGEAGARLAAHALDAEQQGDAERDREQRQQRREATVEQAVQGESEEGHGDDDEWPCSGRGRVLVWSR